MKSLTLGLSPYWAILFFFVLIATFVGLISFSEPILLYVQIALFVLFILSLLGSHATYGGQPERGLPAPDQGPTYYKTGDTESGAGIPFDARGSTPAPAPWHDD